MKLTALAAIAALVCFLLAFTGTGPNDVRHVLLAPATSAPNASVQIDVAAAGASRIEYTITPKVDVMHLDVAFELPPGGEVLQHIAPDSAAVACGVARRGSLRLRLPDSMKMAQVALVATVTIAGAGTVSSPRVETVRSTLIFGAIDDEADSAAMAAGFQKLVSVNPRGD